METRKTIQEVKIGDRVSNNRRKGDGIVIARTKRTISVKFECSTVKLSYNCNDAYFYESDF